MGFLRQGGANNATPDYTGLALQTSVNTLPIPIVWGQAKISPNVVWYGNFQTQGGSSGKGGIFSQSADQVTYTADLIMALCEGPISGVEQIWKNQSIYTLADLGLTFYNGTTPQSTWGYLASIYPNQALAYQGTAYACAAGYALGDSADVGNHNFEIIGILAGTGVNGVDADPAQVINDFLTNGQYGLGFSSANINTATLYGTGGDASLQTYCKAQGICFSPALTDQETASSILQRWLQICNCAAVWSGSQLKFIPYGDVAIAEGTEVAASVTLPVVQPAITDTTTQPAPSIVVCPASLFVTDGGVVYANSGAAFTKVQTNPPNQVGTYCLSPNGTYLFSGYDESAVVQISFTYQIPTTYTPDLTPVYSLDDDDYTIGTGKEDSKDPVQVSRVDPFSLPTVQRIEISDRNNQYALMPIEVRDQSQIEIYGARVGDTITAHEICDIALVGPTVAQLILQRELYIRANFTFKLSWEYGLLEPMDIIEITDANLGLDAYPVRVTTIEEDDNGILTVTAEELTVGISTPVLYPIASAQGAPQARNILPGSVNAPLIYEPPGQLSQALQVWLGVSGQNASVWGGCNIWISADDSNYSLLGTVNGAARQGVLTASLPSVSTTPSGPTTDDANTLSVSLAESAGSLTSGTAADLAAMSTLCLVDNELIAYQNATLTGTNAYNLTTLLRGCYNTQGSVETHESGAPFTRLDSSILKWTYTNALIGQTVYFKFTSFNIYGQSQQSLADVTAYAHTLSGTPTPGLISIDTATLTQVGVTETLAVTWTADPLAATYVVQYSTDGGATYTSIEAGGALSITVPGLGLTAVYVRVAGVSANGVFGPYAAPVEVTGAPINYGAVLGLTYDDLNSAAMAALLSQIDAADQAIVADAQNALAAATTTKATATNANASITTATQTAAAANQALASQITSLNATVGANFATYTNFVQTQTTTNSSVAEQLTTLTSDYGSASESIATLSTTQTTQATELTALSSEVTTLSATALTCSAGGTMTFAAVAGPTGSLAAWELIVTASGQASSSATMSVIANSDGTSTIIMIADRFAIGSPSSNTVPFQTLPNGNLQLNNVTQVNGTIQSLGVGGDGQPYMAINFGSSPSIIIDDGN